MKFTVLDKIKIEKIPSGSGIIKAGSSYHIIGDDSMFLFSLNSDFQITSKTPLLDTLAFSDKRIPKSDKPDFEAMEMIEQNEIVVFGSGSKSPQRDNFIRILLKDPMYVEKYVISNFYNNLQSLPIFNSSQLNIEATAFINDQLFLFNRKINLVIQFDYADLISHLKGKTGFPQPKIRQYSLPEINGIEAGFSGATALKGGSKIIFTASVEDTDNAVDDGEIQGSYIGIIHIYDNNISDNFDYCLIPQDGTILKVESVSIEKEISPGKTEVILITDDDKGNSVIVKGLLTW